jgi:putative ABC transport system ATP-binding protein
MIYSCQNLNFKYRLGELEIKALSNINLNIEQGEFVCLCGPSGSGKSTFLNLLGLIEPLQLHNGEIIFNHKPLSQTSEKEKNQIRRQQLGFIFQSFHLFLVLNTYENVEYYAARQGLSGKALKQVVETSLKAVGLWDRRDHDVLKLSGGQRQRVAIARALAKNPQVIIADEPTASLDQENGHEVMNLLLKLNRDRGTTIIVASHDQLIIKRAPKVILLSDGQLLTSNTHNREITL